MQLKMGAVLIVWIYSLDLAQGVEIEVKYKNSVRKFQNLQYVDGGSYGAVYSGVDNTTGRAVAIKMALPAKHLELQHERDIYVALDAFVDYESIPPTDTPARLAGIPYVYIYDVVKSSDVTEWCGYSVLIMELLGPSLNVDITNVIPIKPAEAVRRFKSMFASVAYFHKQNVIHGDIKPRNFVHGVENESDRIFLIDVGMSRKMSDPSVDYFVVNVYYSSLNCLQIFKNRYTQPNVQLFRKREDDLESLSMVFSMMTFWNLAWFDEMKKFKEFFEKDDHGYAIPIQPVWSAGKAPFYDNVLRIVKAYPDVILEAFTRVDCTEIGKLFQEMILLSRNVASDDLVGTETRLLEKWDVEYEKLKAASPASDYWIKTISHYFRPPPTPPSAATMLQMDASQLVIGLPRFLG